MQTVPKGKKRKGLFICTVTNLSRSQFELFSLLREAFEGQATVTTLPLRKGEEVIVQEEKKNKT